MKNRKLLLSAAVIVCQCFIISACQTRGDGENNNQTSHDKKTEKICIDPDGLIKKGNSIIYEADRGVKKAVYKTYYFSLENYKKIVGYPSPGKEFCIMISILKTVKKHKPYDPDDMSQQPLSGFTFYTITAEITGLAGK